MKRKHRSNLNPTPNISLAGDNLDRLLSGAFTEELRKQLPKTRESEVSNSPIQLLVPREHPLRIVFYENHCRCGSKQRVFGYYCRKVFEKVGSTQISSYKIVEPNGPPQEIAFQQQNVPFCHSCIPNGLNQVKD